MAPKANLGNFPAKVKAEITPGTSLSSAESQLKMFGCKLTRTTRERTVVKDKSGDEPITIELFGDLYRTYSRQDSDAIVKTISIAVLVVDESDCVSHIYAWQEHVGP
ncbi:hypothetical protein [Schlesneria sp.]|uniref:hypothetical protein n=1 Tax=Schlesneria sp. TaxID=2762018 RepID=UPI002F01A48E